MVNIAGANCPGTSGVIDSCNVTSVSDGSISGSATVDPNAPTEQATVTVTSEGYNGSGFAPAQNGQQQNAQGSVQIQAISLPAPQIWFNGSNIAGQTVGVYVGQQIPLAAVVNLPNGAAPSSQAWNRVLQPSGLAGTIVGGYNAQQGAVVTLPAGGDCQSFTSNCITFYWVDPGTWQWQYTYWYAGQSRSATATFSVLGPAISGPEIATQVGSAQTFLKTGTSYLYLLGVPTPFNPGFSAGIVFSSPALPAPGDSGTYLWAQIITADAIQVRAGNPTVVQNCVPPVALPALDNSFPYGVPGVA